SRLTALSRSPARRKNSPRTSGRSSRSGRGSRRPPESSRSSHILSGACPCRRTGAHSPGHALAALRDQLLDPLELVGWRLGDLLDQPPDLVTADRTDLDADLLRLREVGWVLLRRHEGILERLGAIGRDVWRRRKRPRQSIGNFENFDQVAILGI